MAELPLITRYRPSTWDEVVGQKNAIRALRANMALKSCPHTFLFTGPSGVGKTTIARIMAADLDADITEIDAATNNGIDAIRGIITFGQHRAFTKSGKKLFIIDECHMLTRNAWNGLLKTLEDPPAHLYIALCTTEANKIIETVLTRCYVVPLKPLTRKEMDTYLEDICAKEEWTVQPDIFELVLDEASGQPRKALSMLMVVHAAKSIATARSYIKQNEALNEPVIEICQHLISGKKSWIFIRDRITQIEDDAFEEAIILTGRYIMGAMLNPRASRNDADVDEERKEQSEEQRAERIWSILEALVYPASGLDKKLLFVAAIGRFLWA